MDVGAEDRFAAAHAAAASGALADWTRTAEGTLALILLLDQYPRNAFRGGAGMYATDAAARAWPREPSRAASIAQSRPSCSRS